MSSIPGSNYVQIHHPDTKAVSEVDPRSVPIWEGAGWARVPLPKSDEQETPTAVETASTPASAGDRPARARKAADSTE